MANITKKLNKNTGENVQATSVTSWSAEGATDVVLTTANEATYLGGLYNKDVSGYFKWRTTGPYSVSRLTVANQSNFQKLINDIGTSPSIILIDKTILITAIMVIPENITLQFLPGCYFNINTLITVTIKGHILAGKRQWIFSGLGNPVLPLTVDSSIYWFGGKSDSIQLLDGVITAGSKIITSATAAFSSADVGKIMSLIHKDALGVIDYAAGFVVQSVQSATSLTLVAAPTATYTNVEILYATDSLAAYLKMKLALAGGGHVHFPSGTYYLSTGVNNHPSNLRLTGESEYNTTVSFIPTGVAGQSYYDISNGNRTDSAYILNDLDSLFTYQTSTRKNDSYIDLKDASWGESFKPGDIILICGGASYYDQYYGEQNEITKVEQGRIYLKFSLVREYAVEYMQYEGTITADFVQPEIGSTVTVTGERLYQLPAGRQGWPLSVGDNIYTLQVGSNATTAVLLNPGRGNAPAGTVIPAGTKTSKARILYKLIDRPKYVHLEKIRILSAPYNVVRLLRLDNSYGTSLTNCIVEIHPDTRADNNTASFFTDNATNNKFTNVQFISQYFYSTQISRSATRSWYLNCTFKNTGLDISEFAVSTFIINCNFDYNVRLAQVGIINRCIALGNSTSNTIIDGGILSANMEGEDPNYYLLVFTQGEIQRQPVSDVEVYSVTNMIINLGRKIGNVGLTGTKGVVKFNHNKIFGSIDNFGGFGSANNLNTGQTYGAIQEVIGNTFIGEYRANVTNPFLSIAGNVRFEDNYFEFRNISKNAIADLRKTVLRFPAISDFPDSTTVFRNNIFKYFPLTQEWLVINNPVQIDKRYIIENNKFISNQIDRSINLVKSDFNLSLRTSDGDTKGGTTVYLSKKNALTDLKLYKELVESIGGVLSDLNVAVARYVIDALYANNLINKVKYLNIHQGDALAALVPLFGWELGENRYDLRTGRYAEMAGGMIASDYSPTYGWQGDTLGKRLYLASIADIDVTNACLFVQIAKAETKVTPYSIFSGGNNFSLRISQGNLIGIGDSVIKSGYVKSIGFILSSKEGNNQYNLLDTLATPTVSNINSLNTPSNLTPTNSNFRYKMQTHAATYNSVTSCDAGIIAEGVFTFLNETESLLLRDIIRIASDMLGRPVQSPSAQVAAGIVPRTNLSISRSGIFAVVDNGAATITIPHGLGVIPAYWDIRGKNANAKNLGISSEVADATNIIITLGHTNNDGASIEYLWEAKS